MEPGKLFFAQRLVTLRKECKLSQNALASALGYSRGQIANYELGSREPDFSTLIRIAEYFEVSVDYLIGKTNIRSLRIKPSLEKLIDMADALSGESINFLTENAMLLKIKEELNQNVLTNSSTLAESS
jgi:transcriptional regulator with XRE-family HTH domain